jgi:exodeoxyribonuclease VII small subunit
MSEKEISYSEAITEVENILSRIEDQDLDVDELAGQLKRVSELIKICKKKLFTAEKEVEKILKDLDE